MRYRSEEWFGLVDWYSFKSINWDQSMRRIWMFVSSGATAASIGGHRSRPIAARIAAWRLWVPLSSAPRMSVASAKRRARPIHLIISARFRKTRRRGWLRQLGAPLPRIATLTWRPKNPIACPSCKMMRPATMTWNARVGCAIFGRVATCAMAA